MPLIENSTYKPHFLLSNKHVNTILPTIFRKVHDVQYQRKRILTPDGDFLDLDFSQIQSDTVIIAIHGLEGDTHRAYMKGIVKAANKAGYDAVALNMRGCSGEPNNLYSSYHSGKTDDLDLVVNYLIDKYQYSKIMLVGFSMGGNITLKYVGEKGQTISPRIKCAATISVPCMLKDSALQLRKPSNFIYMKRFMRTLKAKALYKKEKHPEAKIQVNEIKKMKTFHDFDNLYTAPAHGYADAEDYWNRASCKHVLSSINIPTLLINAKDDPFLQSNCFPYEEAQKSKYFHLETPNFGGHLGFNQRINFKSEFWHETRIIEFFKQYK